MRNLTCLLASVMSHERGTGCRQGESWRQRVRRAHPRVVPRRGGAINYQRLPAWRHPGQLPQGGNAARVTGLWRVRGGSFLLRS